MARKIIMLLLTLLLVFTGMASADVVSLDRARNAAQNWMTYVVQAYGSWGGASNPAISGEETLVFNGVVVGYNFPVTPKGHVLVSARDDIPAVKLYSDTSTLSLHKEDVQEQIDWISKEIFQIGEAIDTHAVELAASNSSQNPDRELWAILDKDPQEFATAVGETANAAVSYGPLLTSTWGQSSPYNLDCPLWYNGCQTLVGCVATAASQIMNYWKYPDVGQGSTSYAWFNGWVFKGIETHFALHDFDWTNMPDVLTSSSPWKQKWAVAELCVTVGNAFHMKYGCEASGADTDDAPDVFKNYFKYKSTVRWVDRDSYSSASNWMWIFMLETKDGRPSQLRIKDPSEGGHSVVVDGYHNSPSEAVHINMGFYGGWDGWYTPDSFITDTYKWTVTSYQGAAIGIVPNFSAQIMRLWPVTDAAIGKTSTLWAEVKNTGPEALPSNSGVSFFVTGPNWTNNWVGSADVSGLAAGATKWYSYDWTIPSTAAPGKYGYAAVARRYNKLYSDWSSSTQAFIVGKPAVMTSPVNGSKLASTTQTFTWTNVGAPEYWLTIGTIGSSSFLYSKSVGTATSQTVYGLPSNGKTLYARLWTRIGSTWLNNYYTYVATGSGAAVMTSPVNGSMLASTTQLFTWTNVGASEYYLSIGTKPGWHDLYYQSAGTATSRTVYGLPSNGSALYVRLDSKQGDSWFWNAYTYKAFDIFDGFDSQFNGLALNWLQDSGSWAIAGGLYWYTQGRAGLADTSTYNKDYTDLDYSARFWRNGADNNGNQLFIRGKGTIASDGILTDAYVFQYMRNGTFSVFKRVKGVYATLKGTTASTAIVKGSAWNTLRVKAVGSSLSFYINGTLVWSGSDTSLKSGRVGVGMYRDATSAGNAMWVDWATLSVPSTGFDSQFNGSAPNWLQDSGSWVIAGGLYWYTQGRAGLADTSTYNQDFTNLDYSARFWRNGADNNGNQLFIRGKGTIASDGILTDAYVFQYMRNGTFSVFKRVKGVYATLKGTTASTAIVKGSAWNTLRVKAVGSSLSFYINGTLVWSGADTSLTSGRVGVGMYRDATSAGNAMWVDWATLSVPSTQSVEDEIDQEQADDVEDVEVQE